MTAFCFNRNNCCVAANFRFPEGFSMRAGAQFRLQPLSAARVDKPRKEEAAGILVALWGFCVDRWGDGCFSGMVEDLFGV